MTTIRKYGTPLVRQPNGIYLTEDGRYEVTSQDDYLTTCDNPHPVRGKRGLPGYYCEGDGEHYYTRWHIWDNEAGEYAFGDSPGAYETFKEAAESLTLELAREAAGGKASEGREHAYRL